MRQLICLWGMHTKHSGVPQLTKQMFAVTTSWICVQQLRLISKQTRKSSFSYFPPEALLCAPVSVNTTLNNRQVSLKAETFSTYLLWKIWVCGQLRGLKNVVQLSNQIKIHLILILPRTFLSRHFLLLSFL